MSAPVTGERVQRHAFPGEPYRQAFRGVITGRRGKTIVVLADDGIEYDAEPAELVPDGEPWPGAASCDCCPLPTRELSLFDLPA